MSSNIIAIVGRPNVGKSTLFNRILGSREAIVHDQPGVTRDRKYGQAEWAGKSFVIIDTGGYVPESDDIFERAIREQAQIAVEEADLVLFVVDGQTGVLPLDMEIAGILRKAKKRIVLVVNKTDSRKHEIRANEFYELGFGEPIAISALGGRQIGDFLDLITERIIPGDEEPEHKNLHIAIVGKPNVGKSSLVNALLGKERHVVTDIAGTTRDPIDSILQYHGEKITLVDTAGLKKKSRVAESVEFYSAMRALRSIERCDVAVIMLDATRPFDHQDMHIVESTMERHRPALLVVNKWDLVEKNTKTSLGYEHAIRERLGLFDFLPVLFVSALSKQRISKIIERVKEIHNEQSKRIKTGELNGVMLPEIEHYPPSSKSPKEIKIKYVTQLKVKPPLFAFFCNEPKLVQEAYKRFLANKIREHFGYSGVPLSIIMKKK